jgi:hypothetical protein
MLAVADHAKPGTVTALAGIEGGRRVLRLPGRIFTPVEPPLAGMWTEQAQLDCSIGRELVVKKRIQEFHLGLDGRFSVTWRRRGGQGSTMHKDRL